ncbi:MAG TPA: signal peptidase I [Deltaproteobacteria bacterium]|nr:signal peptidase I [Deltaproteobacteria bacterium]
MMSRSSKSTGREWIEALVIAFVLAVLIRAFILHPYKIPSSSMEDTLLRGDHIMAAKFSYGMTVPFTTYKLWGRDIVPKRGDVVIFSFPKDPSLDFVKRVIGLPGETLQIKNKRVIIGGREYLNGHEKFEDAFLLSDGPNRSRDNLGPIKIEPGHVFVMGDNRDKSYDSRFWGQLPVENIKGKAMIVYFSWDSERHAPRLDRIGTLINGKEAKKE